MIHISQAKCNSKKRPDTLPGFSLTTIGLNTYLPQPVKNQTYLQCKPQIKKYLVTKIPLSGNIWEKNTVFIFLDDFHFKSFFIFQLKFK